MVVVGREAEAKARSAGRIVLERVRRAGFDLADSLVECLGGGGRGAGGLDAEIASVRGRFAGDGRGTRGARRSSDFAGSWRRSITAGPPGIAGYASGRPSPRPAFGYWPTAVSRERVPPRVDVRSAADWGRDTPEPFRSGGSGRE